MNKYNIGNREIKFRFWYKGEMLSDLTTWTDDYTEMLNETIKYIKKDGILMQYTGLKDKNGKEIYEGDIIEVKHEAVAGLKSKEGFEACEESFNYKKGDVVISGELYHGIEAYTEREVITEELVGKYLYSDGFGVINIEDSEVIGSIFENPELL